MLEFIADTYRLALGPASPPEEARRVVDDALARAREKHSDFDRFLPGIESLSTSFFVDHRKCPIDALIESLYCAVKHGDFTKSWRVQLKTKQTATV